MRRAAASDTTSLIVGQTTHTHRHASGGRSPTAEQYCRHEHLQHGRVLCGSVELHHAADIRDQVERSMNYELRLYCRQLRTNLAEHSRPFDHVKLLAILQIASMTRQKVVHL